MQTDKSACCFDCKMLYGTFPDMVLPNDLWELINPSIYKGYGMLCPTCIANRLNYIDKWYQTGLYLQREAPDLSEWYKK
jgi:hypothetical protein